MISGFEKILQETTILQGERITLRKFKAEDYLDAYEYGSDELTLKYLIWEGYKSLDDAREGIPAFNMVQPGMFAIELKETGKCIGAIDIRPMPEHEKSGFGYVLNRKYWKNGYMTEALRAILAFCFDTLELNKVESNHFVGNEGSGRVMQKCGMVKEGLIRQEQKVKGVFHDSVHYGITKADWELLR